MKRKLLPSPRFQFAGRGLLLGFALLAGGTAGAQNFVKNPDFEEPLGPDNWTIVYAGVLNSTAKSPPTNSSPADFMVKGRTILAHRDRVFGTWDGNYFGGHFRPNTDWLMHAYFKQTVSGLMPGSNYVVSAWMTQFTGDLVDKVQVYLEARGGNNGTVSRISPYVTTAMFNNPAGWNRYSVTNSATTNGQIEVRLHFNKNQSTGAWKWRNIDAFYDHVSVMLVGQTPPAPTPLSMTITNRTATFQWDAAKNQPYRLEISPDLLTWTTFQDNFIGSGNSLMFTTNLYMSVDNPNYFRAVTEYYDP